MEITDSLVRRFWAKVDKRGADECWEWTGSRTRNYGQLASERSRPPYKAHRLSWVIHRGPIPAGLHVCHSCDNPPCVNPAHLWLGTDDDNHKDMIRKGRRDYSKTNFARGERVNTAKLTAQQVREIRERYTGDRKTLALLSLEYGITVANILNVIERKTWRHIE